MEWWCNNIWSWKNQQGRWKDDKFIRTSRGSSFYKAHVYFSEEYLRCRRPVLQVQSCRCGCHRKTSHWSADRWKHMSTPVHVLTFLSKWNNVNSTPPRPSVWQANQFSARPDLMVLLSSARITAENAFAGLLYLALVRLKKGGGSSKRLHPPSRI